MVHPAGDDFRSVHVEVGAEHLVPVALHPSKDGNVVLRLHVPQPQGVVLRDRQEKVGIPRMELQLVDCIA